jgi:WD40 repeat protein
VFGYPEIPPRWDGAWVDVDLKGQVSGELLQVESRSGQTFKAQPGYSGSPVWDDEAGMAVGLLTGTSAADAEEERDAYLVPPLAIARAWEEMFDYMLLPPNPYRGLEPFTAESADVYFGRDADVDRLEQLVHEHPVVAVVGPSGVGKSSLVRAGLMKALRAEGWSVAVFRPGQDPWERLAAALLRLDSDPGHPVSFAESQEEVDRLRLVGLGPRARYLRSEHGGLLVIADQFEELFANAQSPPDPELLNLLIPPLDSPETGARTVLTIRADFLNALLSFPGVGPRLSGASIQFLSPLTGEQLREVIERPAAVRGVQFAPGLVERIVADAAGGSLPVLQFTLEALWKTQRQRTLGSGGYDAMGGVAGSLDRFADSQVAKLPAETAHLLDRTLLRLVSTVDADTRLTSRRRVSQVDIPETEWKTLQQLADARLVNMDAGPDGAWHAEFAHETLTSAWQRLHRLVKENGDFLAWLTAVQRRAAEGDLLPEARIAEARRWLELRPADVPQSVMDYVDRSEIAVGQRLQEITQARDRAEAARAAAERALRQAETAIRRAEALRLASDAELALRSGSARTTVALALAIESLLTGHTAQGDISLRRVLAIHARPIARLDHDKTVYTVAFSPDGACVATGSGDGSARLLDSATGVELARFQHGGMVSSVSFSRDGTRVATGSDDGTARVFDVTTATQIARLDHGGMVYSVSFSRDGTRVATGSGDGTARVFDAVTGTEIACLHHSEPVYCVAFRRDGTRVATGSDDGTARVFDAVSGTEVARLRHSGPVYCVTFSRDGSRVATGSGDGSSRVFDTASGIEIARFRHDGPVTSVAFNREGTQVVSGSDDRSARVFNAATGAQIARLDHDGWVRSVRFDCEGARVVSGSADGSARVFNAATGAEIARLDHDGWVRSVEFSRDGTRIVSGADDCSARVFSAHAAGAEAVRLDHGEPVTAVAFSPKGTQVATGCEDGSARVFDIATSLEAARLDHGEPVTAVAFSPKGTQVATGSADGSARVFEVATSAQIARLDHDGAVHAVAFSPKGTLVATGSADGSARVFEALAALLIERAQSVMTRPLRQSELRLHSLGPNPLHAALQGAPA